MLGSVLLDWGLSMENGLEGVERRELSAEMGVLPRG